jgi:hypothetical protein
VVGNSDTVIRIVNFTAHYEVFDKDFETWFMANKEGKTEIKLSDYLGDVQVNAQTYNDDGALVDVDQSLINKKTVLIEAILGKQGISDEKK